MIGENGNKEVREVYNQCVTALNSLSSIAFFFKHHNLTFQPII